MTASLAAAFAAAALLVLPVPAGNARLRSTKTASLSPLPSGHADPNAVPAAFDLFAACLRAGMPAATAARAVAESAPPGFAAALRRGADRLALGADPADAWDGAGDDELLDDFARAARRSAKSGAPLSDTVAELAVRYRAEAEDRVAADIERAGVLVAGPLGLCFLPAFVCLGIVPVVIGLARDVLGGGLL
ncbi:type II secretion system F family protein [Rhodococcus coprophilus]|uniref:Type ii secretion system integral membrane subunit n=1 Tax=Rhodococcus coprophilus TaxID=38310 RepID=A0A2X4U038_9NOCA|nr:type II secretion system F family protein [Rhodococcus coprophilus]MBM7458471.1 pilus assembly protein TadC [Rhodococcus coprophilus]SQI32543.1 type ii secretion system integral membrane subunit [Rhodococcus coprophilus]